MKLNPSPQVILPMPRLARPRGGNAQAHLINRFAPSLRVPASRENWSYLKAMRQAEMEAWNAVGKQ
jgi:hypothetical protein